MINLSSKLNQTVTYWSQTGEDLFGKGTFASPIQLQARWEDVAEMFIDKTGQESVSKAKVFLAQDISLEGYLVQGTSAGTDPTVVAGAQEVRQIKRTPDLRNLQTLYVAML